jgi:hypothetical protein
VVSSSEIRREDHVAVPAWYRPALRTIAGIVLAFVLSVTSVLSLSLLSARVDNPAVTASIEESLQSGASSFPTAWDRNTETGIDTWTDCLVLEIATYGEKDVVSALARSRYRERFGQTHECDDLLNKVRGPPIEGSIKVVDYWRYWWGSAALLNVALGVLNISLPAYQAALKALTYFAILLVTSTAFLRYRRAALPFLPLAVALTFAFALPLFSQSIADAPGLIVGLLLVWGYMVARVDRAEPGLQIAYVFFAGVLCLYFDLLNGNMFAVMMCFGLIRLLGGIASGVPPTTWVGPFKRFSNTTAVFYTLAAYVAGAISMAFFRILLHGALTGQSLVSALSEWHGELAKYESSRWSESEFPGHGTLIGTLRHCYYYLDVATFPYLGRPETLIAHALCWICYLVTFGWLFARRRRLTSERRDQVFGVLLIASVVPIWYSLFFVHTAIHFWMMGRLLSLFSALAVSLGLLVLMGRTEARASLRPTCAA